MAKFQKKVDANFDELLQKIEQGILEGSISASLEDSSDFKIGKSRCSVRVFERYSAFGGNRLSLNVTLFQVNDSKVYVSAITAGGSKAKLFKINKIGEEAFLDEFKLVMQSEK